MAVLVPEVARKWTVSVVQLNCYYKWLYIPSNKIKALKTLVWHLSREPMKEISSLKKKSVMYNDQVRANKAKD